VGESAEEQGFISEYRFDLAFQSHALFLWLNGNLKFSWQDSLAFTLNLISDWTVKKAYLHNTNK